MNIDLRQGNCLELMKTLADNSIDSIVTDPPYGLSFMGKKWDYDVPSVEIWKECLRVLKHGGYLLAFAGTRTQHRMACNIEDAGFEIRDMIAWVYGSGFPKSHNIGKTVDKLHGNEREVVGVGKAGQGMNPVKGFGNVTKQGYVEAKKEWDETKGNSEWEGWGTALKPALEPITVARKPLSEKTVALNVLKYGTGGINIDGCRVKTDENLNGGAYSKGDYDTTGKTYELGLKRQEGKYEQPQGRFPANFIHDGSDEVVGLFPDTKTGDTKAIPYTNTEGKNVYGKQTGVKRAMKGDSGSASRFFYCAKTSKKERNMGCEGMPLGEPPASARSKPAEGRSNALGEPRANNHPTVKPIALMEYLVKLVSRKDAIVLDPFMGSGSTGVACKNLNRNFIGFELDEDYIEIAKNRIEII